VHGLHRLDRVAARRRFGREHDRVGALVDGGGDVRDLGPRRHRRGDHGFQHLRRHDHRLGGGACLAHQAFLDRGNVLHRQLDAEIAARDHDPVGQIEDLVEDLQRRGLLDLGQDRRAAARKVARLDHVGGPLHEAQRQPVDAEAAGEFQIGPVLGRERGDGQFHIGDVHALAVRDGAADNDGAIGMVAPAILDPEPDLAVIDQQHGARGQHGEDLGMRQADAVRVALLGVEVQPERHAFLEIGGAGGEDSDAQLRALQIGEDADGPAGIDLDGADHRVARGDFLVGAMAHVEPEDIGPGVEQRPDRGGIVRGRPERGDDLHVSMTSHGGGPACCLVAVYRAFDETGQPRGRDCDTANAARRA
jgi:hypothetical protein